MSSPFRPTSLDHVALWVAQRAPLAAFLCDHLGMHVIEETDTFTLVGVDAKLGKLTLFDAEGPRERGSIEHIALRVGDLDAALGALESMGFERHDGGLAVADRELRIVDSGDSVDGDRPLLNHIALL